MKSKYDLDVSVCLGFSDDKNSCNGMYSMIYCHLMILEQGIYMGEIETLGAVGFELVATAVVIIMTWCMQ